MYGNGPVHGRPGAVVAAAGFILRHTAATMTAVLATHVRPHEHGAADPGRHRAVGRQADARPTPGRSIATPVPFNPFLLDAWAGFGVFIAEIGALTLWAGLLRRRDADAGRDGLASAASDDRQLEHLGGAAGRDAHRGRRKPAAVVGRAARDHEADRVPGLEPVHEGRQRHGERLPDVGHADRGDEVAHQRRLAGGVDVEHLHEQHELARVETLCGDGRGGVDLQREPRGADHVDVGGVRVGGVRGEGAGQVRLRHRHGRERESPDGVELVEGRREAAGRRQEALLAGGDLGPVRDELRSRTGSTTSACRPGTSSCRRRPASRCRCRTPSRGSTRTPARCRRPCP